MDAPAQTALTQVKRLRRDQTRSQRLSASLGCHL